MAAADSVSIFQSKENGGGDSLSHSETPAVIDDDYGTASESEDSNEEIYMPAVENGGNRKLGLSEIPNLVGVKDERVEGVEVLSGGSNLEEEGESKTEGFVNGVEGNGLGFAENEKNGKNSVNDTNSKPVVAEAGTEKNLAVDDTKSKPVGVEVEAGTEKKSLADEVEAEDGTEKNWEPSADFDANGESEAIAATVPLLEEKMGADLKPKMEEVGSIQESQEATDSRPSVEPEKDVEVHIVGSNQNLEEAVETLKPVEVETNAVDTGIVELKYAEKEELDAAMSEKDKKVIGKGEMTSSLAQIVDGLVESEAAGAETNAVMAKENGVTDIPVVSQDVDAAIESKAEEEETMDAGAEKNKAVDGTSAERSLDLVTCFQF